MKESIDTLFTKYLDDQCDTAEIKLLLEHFKLPESEGLLKKVILLELEKQSDVNTMPVDLNSRIAAIQGRVTAHIQKSKAVKQPLFARLWPRIAMAAAVVVIISATILYYNGKNSFDKLEQQIAASQIKPGRGQAILTLANGSKVQLSDVNGKPVYVVPEDSSGTGTKYNTIEAPAGGQWQVVLADGTRVWLNALSSITYPTSFTGAERKVKIDGEAYFEVAHNEALPFRVQSAGQTVEVLGTKFNIMAYYDEAQAKTTLLEGSVRIAAGKDEKILRPGEQALVMNGDVKIENDVDLESAIAWKNGDFIFKGEDFKTTMRKIARWYNVEISYDPSVPADIELAGWISRDSQLSIVLKRIELAGKIHFNVEGRRITVMK
jgi:transmembrane sensor